MLPIVLAGFAVLLAGCFEKKSAESQVESSTAAKPVKAGYLPPPAPRISLAPPPVPVKAQLFTDRRAECEIEKIRTDAVEYRSIRDSIKKACSRGERQFRVYVPNYDDLKTITNLDYQIREQFSSARLEIRFGTLPSQVRGNGSVHQGKRTFTYLTTACSAEIE